MYFDKSSNVYSYDGHGISFSTADKKFAVIAFKHIKRLAEKKLAERTDSEIEELDARLKVLA
jgi:hypothetical protein